jgi:acetylornithine deacetylase/succinyl-diaminopimelate desuccinylase-like protein
MTSDISPPSLFGRLETLSDEVFAAGVERLRQLIRIPSLSVPSAPDGPVEESARAVRDMFVPVMDWDFMEIVRAPGGRPAVIARKNPQPGKPTVLLYAHHDVQPAGEPDQWASDPFEADIRNGRIYGRGSADDGAGIITHWQALTYLTSLDSEDAGGLGIVVFIEGEEESGSPTFAQLLAQYRDTLASDVIIVADSDNPSPTTPALTTSLRGVVGLTVSVVTADFPVHSGLFGGLVPDAPTALVRLLATLYDEAGHAALQFPLPAQRAGRAFDEEAVRREAGLRPGVDLMGEGPISDRLWWAPAITVTGFDAPKPEQASNTLWPSARARVSMRIPPSVSPQEAAAALVDHLTSHAPWGVEVSVSDVEMGPGFVGDTDSPSVGLFAACATEVFGNTLQFQGVGGTIPFISQLSEVFPEATVLVTGVEDQESRAHGVNESVDAQMLKKTGITEALFLLRLSQVP